jgi:hypothetical protein|tara:strand:- start:67 stop:279 length:213 start_codon:yes stop_codon:yes gene_type:complete
MKRKTKSNLLKTLSVVALSSFQTGCGNSFGPSRDSFLEFDFRHIEDYQNQRNERDRDCWYKNYSYSNSYR